MTALSYNTRRHPQYGATELKRLAGIHAMYSLFIAAGIVGAVFLVLYSVSFVTGTNVIPIIKIKPPIVITNGGDREQPSDPGPQPRGETHTSSSESTPLPTDPGIGTKPVDREIIQEPVKFDPITNVGNESNINSDPFNGRGGDGSTVSGTSPKNDGQGHSPVVSNEQDPVFEEIPDIMPVADEATILRSIIYPPMAKRIGLNGKVVVSVLIGIDGRAVSVGIASSTNEIFDKAALEAVSKATFKPAYRNGKPVQFRLYVPIEFKMK